MLLATLTLGGLTLMQVFILVVLVAAGCAIVVIAVKGMGVTIPQWAIQIFWVVLIAVVAILAIHLIAALW